MADQRVKKRSWGKTKQREEITIINHEKIEETLQKLAEEAKTSQSNEQKDGNTVNSGSRSSGVDLQYPELMSNDALIAALKRIKVPIPVYPDGTPSRERLLYLYKTNVMPRPQRNSWTRGRQRRKASKEDAVGVMEVDQEDDGAGWNETSTSNMIPQRKRKLSDSDKTVEGGSQAKRISLTPANSKPTPPIPTGTTTTTITAPSSSLTNLRLQESSSSSITNNNNNTRKVLKLKRPAAAVVVPPNQRAQTTPLSSPSNPSARTKITWP